MSSLFTEMLLNVVGDIQVNACVICKKYFANIFKAMPFNQWSFHRQKWCNLCFLKYFSCCSVKLLNSVKPDFLSF